MMSEAAAADRLRDLARQAAHLPPPSHRDPEAFHVKRAELAAALRRLAREIQEAR